MALRRLPKRFFPVAEQLIQPGRHGGGERLRITPRRAQRIPRRPAIKGQLDIVAASVQLGQHPADVVARIAFDFQVEDADPRVLEQGSHGRVPRLGADQRLPDAD